MYDIRGFGPFWVGRAEDDEQIKGVKRVWIREIDHPYRVGVGLGTGSVAAGLCRRKRSELEVMDGEELDATVEEIRDWTAPLEEDDGFEPLPAHQVGWREIS